MKRAVVVLLLLVANILFASCKVTPPEAAPGIWDEGYSVIVLANVAPTVAQDAADYITDRLPAAARVARQ